MVHKRALVQLLFLIVVAKLFAQDITFDHLTTEQGLSNNTISCIIQDKEGFIWIGTEDGLNRFDGYSFTVYRNNANDSTSLSDNKINQVLEDKNGKLWIATNDGGLDCLNRKTNKFEHYLSNRDEQNSLLNNFIVQLFEDSNQNLWVMSSNSGLNLYQPKSNDFKRVPLPITGSTRENPASLIYEDKRHNLWIAGNTGLVKYRPQNDSIQKFTPNINKQSDIANSVNLIVPKNDTILYVFVDKAVYLFDLLKEQFIGIDPIISKIHTNSQILVAKIDSLNIWLGSYNGGLIKISKRTNYITTYLHNRNNTASLSTNIVNTMYQDRSGSVWVGTYMQGVNKFDMNQKFKSYLNRQIITSIYDNGNDHVWIGSQTSGLYKHNLKTDQWTNYLNNPIDSKSLSYNDIVTVYEDKQKRLWVGTWEHGLNRANILSNNDTTLKFDHLLGKESIISIAEDSKDRLWLGSNNSLYLHNSAKDIFVSFANEPNLPESFGHASVQAIKTDTNGDLWICTWSGLHHIILPINQVPTTKNISVTSYYNDPKSKNTISDNRTLSLCLSTNGTLWIGTYARGITKMEFDSNNKTNYKCTHYMQQDGLPSNCVFGIQEDENGLLWISTNKGFASFNPSTETFLRYDKNDGLQGDEFNWRSSFKSSTGLIYFGGSNGFTSFYPAQIKLNSNIPPVVITGFSLFNEPITPLTPQTPLKTDIGYTKEITLQHWQSMISFDYAAISYISTDKNRYKYKMEGFDKNWVNAGVQRRATYTNLDPGKYTFCVIAANNDGVWNMQGATIKLTILPPFWQTWWFRLFSAFLAMALIIGVYEWRVRQLKKQKKVIEEIVKAKTLELHYQKEDLLALNEELTAFNEQLHQQQQEMETLNEELSSSNEELEVTLQSLKETQTHLIQSEKMASLGILSAGIAHEINNPLNFINGGVIYLEGYMKENLQDKFEEIKPVIDGIYTGVKRTADIVKSLNQYTRNDAASFTICNLHDTIDNCLVMLQNQFKNRIEIQKQYTQTPFIFAGNEGKLHQAFLNILGNAGQAISENGVIKIESNIINNSIQIKISDSGSGISPENLPKIFDPFFTTKPPGEGTGLGLSITLNIIKEHKGTIEYESQLEVGTTVIIKLPLNS